MPAPQKLLADDKLQGAQDHELRAAQGHVLRGRHRLLRLFGVAIAADVQSSSPTRLAGNNHLC